MDAEPFAPGAIRLARVAYPWNGSRCSSAPVARTDLGRVPMPARTAGTGDGDLDRSRNTPRRRRSAGFRLLDGRPPTGTAMSSTNRS
jgi:hypothetical protein